MRVTKHIYEPCSNTYNEHSLSSVSRYFLETHQGDVSLLRVMGIEKVIKPVRGGDWANKRFIREAHWILKQGTYYPNDPNYKTDLMYLY